MHEAESCVAKMLRLPGAPSNHNAQKTSMTYFVYTSVLTELFYLHDRKLDSVGVNDALIVSRLRRAVMSPHHMGPTGLTDPSAPWDMSSVSPKTRNLPDALACRL